MVFNIFILLPTLFLTTNLLFAAEMPQSSADDKLFLAASRGDLTEINTALANNANVYAQNSFNEQVTHVAARNGSVQTMHLLFNHGANINALSSSYEPLTPLRIAIKRQHIALVRWLLEHGARVTEDDFAYAATEVTELLAKFYFVPTADLWGKLNNSEDSAISDVFVQAAAINNVIFLRAWCNSPKISFNIANRAFLIAAIRGNYEAVECLLSHTKDTEMLSFILKYITGLLKGHSLSSFSEIASYRKIKSLLEQKLQAQYTANLPRPSIDLNPALFLSRSSTLL